MDVISDHYKRNVMAELCKLIQPDKKRKVCKDCGIPGHNNKSQLVCHIKKKEDNEKREMIKKYVLNIDPLTDYDNEGMFELLAKKLDISLHSCKKLYAGIPPETWINRKMNISEYVQNVYKCCCKCCGDVILEFSKNKIWKGNILCDYCWDSHRGERELMWVEIKEYKPIVCYICNKKQRTKGERFHYDHLNMFDKSDSVCSMVDRGDSIKDIFLEIDKCQILCVPCHHIVTSIEQKIGFTRIKTNLTRKFNNEEISEEIYLSENKKYEKLYEEKMKSIYEQLKKV